MSAQDTKLFSAFEQARLLVAAVVLVDDALVRRETARRERRWDDADAIREQLSQLGLEVEDTPDGPKWYVVEENPDATKRFNAWLASQRNRRAGGAA